MFSSNINNKFRYLTIIRLLYSCVYFFCVSVVSASVEEFKLSDDIVPSFQVIELKLDPKLAQYSGNTTIEINITKPSKIIKLYSKGLLINSVTLERESSQHSPIKLAVVGTNVYDITSFSAKKIVDKGKYKLSISYQGKYINNGSGLFKVTESNENYLFTQFQAMLARTVFPSFDQPNFKISFQFKISVPKGYLAISNTPKKQLISHNGWDTFMFEPTAPIYTDVLAFSVGKFDSIDIPHMPIPSKLYVLKGKLPQTNFATKHISTIFKAVESSFSIKYPYKKLDMIAVPNYSNAAMEHVGLIYYKEDLILLDPVPSISEQKYSLKLIAHEISHMWFGNLVTMQWWNDLWLNESFAEWLARKVVINTFPTLSASLDLPQIRSLFDDNVDNQLPIRRSVKSKADADSMGGIAYYKGNAILNMVEQYIGEDEFHQAVIAYLLAYKNTNATLHNFVKHIERVSNKELSGFFSSFLEQPGFPLLTLKRTEGKLLIYQSPFGVSDEANENMLWHIPLQLKFLSKNGVKKHRVFLKNKTLELTIPDGVIAIFPDANAVGYYRYVLPDKDENYIKKHITQLDDNEKLAWLNNNVHLTNITLREYTDVLTTKLALLSDTSLNKKIATDIIRDIDHSYTEFIPEEIINDYSRYLKKHLNLRLMALTSNFSNGKKHNNTSNNSITDKALMASLFRLAGSRLRDKSTIEFAKDHYLDILSEKSSIDSSISREVLNVVASNFGENEYSLFESAYVKTTNSRLKSDILTSMGYFASPKIVTRYFDFLLSGKVPTDEIGYRFQYPSFNPALRHHVINYIENNKDEILKRINEKQWFPYNFITSCEEDIRARVNQVFSSWTTDTPGLKEKLNTVNETIKQCISKRANNIPQLKRLLLM